MQSAEVLALEQLRRVGVLSDTGEVALVVLVEDVVEGALAELLVLGRGLEERTSAHLVALVDTALSKSTSAVCEGSLADELEGGAALEGFDAVVLARVGRNEEGQDGKQDGSLHDAGCGLW